MALHELAAWRSRAEGAVQAVGDARSDLLQRKQELDSMRSKMDLLADRLLARSGGQGPVGQGPGDAFDGSAFGAGAVMGAAPARPSPKRDVAGSWRAGVPTSMGSERLPRLKTRAVPGAALQPALGGAPTSPSRGLPTLASSPTASWGGGSSPTRRGGAGPAFGGTKKDRAAESKRDEAMVAYQAAHWNRGS